MSLDFPSDPGSWSFYQLVSELERAAGPDAAPVGELGPAALEPLRFRNHASLAFPHGDVTAILLQDGVAEPGDGGAPIIERLQLTCTFLGLYGTVSPLPVSYTERIISADLDRSDLKDFLDYFNHRLIALLYRSWRKYRAYANVALDGGDAFTARLFALGGIADAEAQLPAPIDRMRLLPFVGLMRLRTKSAGTLARILQGYFRDVDVRIEELVQRPVTVPDWQRNQLGKSGNLLGSDFILGDQGSDVSGKIRVWMGPLGQEQFQRFLPDGEEYAAMQALMRLLLPTPLEVDLALKLEDGAVPPMLLGGGESRLGWSSWAGEGNESDRTVVFGLV